MDWWINGQAKARYEKVNNVSPSGYSAGEENEEKKKEKRKEKQKKITEIKTSFAHPERLEGPEL